MRFRLLFLFLFVSILSQAQNFDAGVFENHCTSPEERKLYTLINEYRTSKQLPAIELSASLCYVAKVHAMDLAFNRPDFGGCNPHSWSDKGKWKPCCYAKDENRTACMTTKPKELTGYRYKAYETVYYDGEAAKPEDAIDLWTSIELMNDYLLNTGKWTKPWKAMGVGIYHNYACVWFGEGEDAAEVIIDCGSDSLKRKQDSLTSLVTNDPSSYFIITSSAGTIDQANQEVKRLKGLGYANARHLKNASFYRISVDFFRDEESAYKALEKVKKVFPDAWLLKPKVIN